MTLEDKIHQRIIAYYRGGSSQIALELAALFLLLADRDKSEESRQSRLYEFFWWIRAARFSVSRYLKGIGCWLERERIKRLLGVI